MKKIIVALLIIAAFMLGILFNSAYALYSQNNIEHPLQIQFPFSETEKNIVEKIGPKDRVKEEQIKVYQKGIVLAIENTTWSRFTDTHSMDPIINKDSNGIEVRPKSENDVSIGDIISYNSEFADGLIVHRVVAQGYDDLGWYVLVKGDNLKNTDPGKIRFSQIHGVLVAIIY